MLSQAVEDYIKTIHKLQENGLVSTTELANELNISGASVTGMLKRLATMGLVDYNSYKGVRLSESGSKIASEIIRHHRLLELYLKEMLGYSLDKVHEEACRLEHHISEEFADKIDSLLGNPEFDPHGHPIPPKNGDIPKTLEKPLSMLEIGKDFTIKRLADDDPEKLAFFEKMGFLPNTPFQIIDKAPFNGPISLKMDGKDIIIGNELATSIFVEV
ncbi:MAG: metal-dependent transcriptional regulator [Candidatus Kapabacteria bacterium]|nr:metal-dependent transcriptional regulator [Candidatus Kapabacteria bacterium]